LERRLSLSSASAVNIVAMIGMGRFITMLPRTMGPPARCWDFDAVVGADLGGRLARRWRRPATGVERAKRGVAFATDGRARQPRTRLPLDERSMCQLVTDSTGL